MVSAQIVEASVANNSPSQDSNHLDDLFQSRYSWVQTIFVFNNLLLKLQVLLCFFTSEDAKFGVSMNEIGARYSEMKPLLIGRVKKR